MAPTAPGVFTEELTLDRGIAVGHCIEMLMRAAGYEWTSGKQRARSKHQTRPRVIPSTVSFTRDEPNKFSVTDITGHSTREAKFSRAVAKGYVVEAGHRVVYRQIADSDRVTNALGVAIANRGPTPGTLIHSDYGVQGGFNWLRQHVAVELIVGVRPRLQRGSPLESFSVVGC